MSNPTTQDAEAVARHIPQEVDYANGIITAAIAFKSGTLSQEGIRPFIDAYREAVERRARAARRTETYPHDCGCETCPDHTGGSHA